MRRLGALSVLLLVAASLAPAAAAAQGPATKTGRFAFSTQAASCHYRHGRLVSLSVPRPRVGMNGDYTVAHAGWYAAAQYVGVSSTLMGRSGSTWRRVAGRGGPGDRALVRTHADGRLVPAPAERARARAVLSYAGASLRRTFTAFRVVVTLTWYNPATARGEGRVVSTVTKWNAGGVLRDSCPRVLAQAGGPPALTCPAARWQDANTLSWPAVPGATAYVVQQQRSDGGAPSVNVVAGTSYAPAARGDNPNFDTWVEPMNAGGVLSCSAKLRPVTDRLTLGTVSTLYYGAQLTSPSGQFTAHFQADGNFALWQGAKPLWSIESTGDLGSQVRLQTDGNWGVFNGAGSPRWAALRYAPGGGSYLVVGDDGYLALKAADGRVLWRGGGVDCAAAAGCTY